MILDDDPNLARVLGKLGSRPASLPCNSHVAIICHFHKILRHANEHDLASALHPPISLTFVTRGTNWMKLQTQWVFFRQFLETAAGVFGLQQPASSRTIPSPSRPNQGPTLRCPSGKLLPKCLASKSASLLPCLPCLKLMAVDLSLETLPMLSGGVVDIRFPTSSQ